MPQIWLVPAFPLLGFVLNGLFGKALGKRFVSIVGPLTIGLAFLQSLSLFFAMLGGIISEAVFGVISMKFKSIFGKG